MLKIEEKDVISEDSLEYESFDAQGQEEEAKTENTTSKVEVSDKISEQSKEPKETMVSENDPNEVSEPKNTA